MLLAGTGVLYELALRRPGSFVYRAIAAVIGVAAIVAGEADDAPGLVGFGCLVVLGTIALAVRPPGAPGSWAKSSALASSAPRAIASSFAHSTRQSVRVAQSVPAMTFSAPTTSPSGGSFATRPRHARGRA